MSALAISTRCALLGEQLINDGLITPEQLEQALEHQQKTGAFVGEALVALNFIAPAAIASYLTNATGFPFVNLSETAINLELARLIPEHLARRKRVLPFAEQGDSIHVALVDPLDLGAIDDLRARLNRRILPFLALESDLTDAVRRCFDTSNKAQSILDEIGEDSLSTIKDVSLDELVGMAEDAPIVRLVNGIVHDAVISGSSDIHIEPQEHIVRVRFRQDGMLYDQMTFARNHLAAVVSRIKIMSHLNIAERRRPQDGRFVHREESGDEFDLRVSLLPLIYGEKVVMRVLKKTSSFSNPDRLGLFPEQRDLFERFIQRPHGIMLVTGPTGSGKSTTLYAALNRINDAHRNISTIEDPVEYHLNGVNQMQVFPQIGVTFSVGLRALMRQDPDVIMVGEIRDKETAETAIQAALTGHLVLSTLHTNDAPGALVRLQNMGIEPFLISSAIIGVIGQRLLRTICPNCKESSPADRTTVEAFGVAVPLGPEPVLAHGVGCNKCGGRGMKGRTAVYEFMPMSDTLRQMVLEHRSGAEMAKQAASEGMSTLRESGIRKMLEGHTTPDEIVRVLFSEGH